MLTTKSGRTRKFIPKELLSKLENARSSGAMEGERRIITMLFCDVQGSTGAASQLDPEEWADIINGAFEHMIAPIYRYEGTLARLMGDAILAFFGAPITHEDDPQRAVLAALEIVQSFDEYREKVQREWDLEIDVRVGINTGLVVVGAVGSDLRMEYTAMGDAINLAARMEQTAEPGTVQISEATFKQIAPLVDVWDLGEIEVKGKSEPVKVYRVLSMKPEAGQLRGIEGLDSPLVGRDNEVGILRTAIADLRHGRGQIIALIGEAGLGKSRLVADMHTGASAAVDGRSGIQWLQGRCLSFQTSTPYAPFTDLFRDHFENLDGQPDEKQYQHIFNQIETVNQKQVNEIAPYIASMLGVALYGAALDRIKYLEPPVMRQRTFGAIATYLESLSIDNPIVLVVDDLHWVDPTSLELLQSLLPLTDRTTLLLLVMFRPQRQEPSWNFHETATRDYTHRYQIMHLNALDETDSRQLVANLLHVEELPESVRALILQKAEGNPFFVEEVIRSLLDSGLVVRSEGHWHATKEIENITVPDTLAAVINTRLDRLDEESRRVTQSAAVIGRHFSHDILVSMQPTRASLDEPLTDLQRRELIHERTRIPERTYSFKHALTQETAYNTLLLKTRRELHLRVAGVLERTAAERVNEIAHHYVAAREPARALPFLVEAADRAAKAYSTQEAIGLYRQALDILDTEESPAMLRRAYEGQGNALTFANQVPEAVENYQSMLAIGEQSEDIPMQVSALNKLSYVSALRLGQYEQADHDLAQSEERARAHEDKYGLSELGLIRCMMCTAVADFDGVVRYMGETVALGRELGVKEQMTMGFAHVASSQVYMLQFDKAMETFEEGLSLSREIGDRLHEAKLLASTGTIYHMSIGELVKASDLAHEAMGICLEIGDVNSILYVHRMLGFIAHHKGEYELAIDHYQKYLDLSRSNHYPWTEAEALCLLGTTYLDISTVLLERVLGFHGKAIEVLEMPGGNMMGGTAWAELGYCMHAANRHDDASAYFQKGLEIPTITGQLERPRLLVGAARVELDTGNVDRAAQMIAEARVFAEDNSLKFVFPLVACAAGAVAEAQGDLESARVSYSRAEADAIEMGMRPLIWQARVGAARVFAALGQHSEADAKRAAAQDQVDEIGALFENEDLRSKFLESAQAQVGAAVPALN